MQLSTKDLHYLKDELSWELVAMKKCRHYAQECQDPDIRQLLDRIGRIHQQHYDMLLNQLDPAHPVANYTPANPGTPTASNPSPWGTMNP